MGIRSLTHPVTSRRKWRKDVIKRLDELAQVQTKLVEAAAVQVQVASAQVTRWERQSQRQSKPLSEPQSGRLSKRSWRLIIFFVLSVTLLVASSVVLSVSSSGLDSTDSALSLHANQLLSLAIKNNNPALMRESLKELASVNSGHANMERIQLFAQTFLALGSALLGAILGWIITQLFDALRSTSRRTGSKSSQSADDDRGHEVARRTPSA